MQTNTGSIYVKAFTADGWMLSLSLPCDNVHEAMQHFAEIKNAGLLCREPGMTVGEDKAEIRTVIRREYFGKDNKDKVIVDMYPDWKGEFGTFKWYSKYLNNAADIAEFEQFSGLRFADMPIYEGQAAINRVEGRPNKCEVTVKKRFAVVKVKDGEQLVNGKTVPKWEWGRYESLSGDSPNPVQHGQAPASDLATEATKILRHYAGTGLEAANDADAIVRHVTFGEWDLRRAKSDGFKSVIGQLKDAHSMWHANPVDMVKNARAFVAEADKKHQAMDAEVPF